MIKIVICDDERIFLDKLTDLTNTFFEKRKTAISIRCFDNSSDFISDLKNHTNLFLLDIMMPGMDGYETCKKIREKYDMPIIFISALSETDNMLDGYHVGADGVYDGPAVTENTAAAES